jgi:hypothetical protein
MAPSAITGLIKADGARATVKAPEKPGAFRVFVFVSDGKGHTATANVPVQVTP